MLKSSSQLRKLHLAPQETPGSLELEIADLMQDSIQATSRRTGSRRPRSSSSP